MSQLKTLAFDPVRFVFTDSEQLSFPLKNPDSGYSWSTLPWKESEVQEFFLDDLPCRLTNQDFYSCFKTVWKACAHEAVVTLKVPHPRHDVFFREMDYVKTWLPESWPEILSRLRSQSDACFELVDIEFSLDSHWQAALENNQITQGEIPVIARQFNNVIEWVVVKLKAQKSTWAQVPSGNLLTPEMKDQLQKQMIDHEARGNLQAAQTVRQFLEKENQL